MGGIGGLRWEVGDLWLIEWLIGAGKVVVLETSAFDMSGVYALVNPAQRRRSMESLGVTRTARSQASYAR